MAGFVRRRLGPLAAGAAVVGLVATAGVVWIVAAPTVPPVDCSSLQANHAPAANVLAIACDADVEVTDERTPWASTWAGPDGTFRMDMTSVPQVAQVDGEWVPVDSTLVEGEATIKVAAPVFPIFLNPGGPAGAGKPLGSIERDGHVFEIWFPLDLPVPTVEKSQVLYDLGDGIRLAVTVNADTTGFIPVLEVADPEAAVQLEELLDSARAAKGLPGSGLELAYPVTVSDEVTLTVDEFAQMQALDAEGEVLFSSPPPLMWDSSGETIVVGSEVTEVEATNRTLQPSGGDHVATMLTRLNDSTLVVTPDAAMLSSADTVWPVYIDPGIYGEQQASQRIAVRTGGYTNTLGNWEDATSSLRGEGTGNCSDVATCNVAFKQRLVWRFDGLSEIASLATDDVISASFTVNGVHSFDCEARKTTLWRTADIAGAPLWDNLDWIEPLGYREESQRANCPNGTPGLKEFDATAGFEWVAAMDSTTISLGLLVDESSMLGWKRFTNDATISVEYNRAPNVPTAQSFSSPSVTTCTTGIGRPVIATNTPMLSATFSDPDGGMVSPYFQVARVSNLDVFVWRTPEVPAEVLSGSTGTAVVPGILTNGVAYAWRAMAFDGSLRAYTEWCEFSVDTVAPSVPSVKPVTVGALAAYPENRERSGVGLTGQFTVHRIYDQDVVAFQYGFNDPLMTLTAVPDSNGAATISFTPTTAGPVTLTVRSRDLAGNFSPTRSYVFQVGTPSEDGIWTLDEGNGLTAADSAGADRPLTVTGATWTDGPHALFDSREDDGALQFDGINDFAQSTAPVVNTTDSFAVSTHVLLDPSGMSGTQVRTVLSQDGASVSGFRLEYRPSCPGTSGGCWAFAMADNPSGNSETVVHSTRPVIGGEWTHLVGAYNATTDELSLWVCEVGTPQDPAIGEPIKTTVSRTVMPWPTTAGLQLGRSLAGGTHTSYWDGSIDNVRVFDGQVLSEAKIRRLCQGAEATDFVQGDNAFDPTTATTYTTPVTGSAPVVTYPLSDGQFETGGCGANYFNFNLYATATGSPAPTIQWQRMSPKNSTTGTWSNITGGTTNYTVHSDNTLTEGDYRLFRAVFTSGGYTTTSPTVQMTLTNGC